MNVVVVGNGPSALDHPYGKRIDAFDEVVRFNDFKLDGFHEHIGCKTTIWAANDTMQPGRDVRGIRQILFAPLLRLYARNGKPDHGSLTRFRHAYGKRVCEVPRSTQERVYDWFGYNYYSGDRWPMTGSVILQHLVDLHGQITIYGFDSFARRERGEIHYWKGDSRNLVNTIQTGNGFKHDVDMEAAFLEHLASQDQIVRLEETE